MTTRYAVGVAAGLVVLFGLSIGLSLWGSRAQALEVGPETTVVEGPLRDDGTVDYSAVLNEIVEPGREPERNAYTLIARLQHPDDWADDHRQAVFRQLGVPVPAEHATYFVGLHSYARQRSGADPRWEETAERADNGFELPHWELQWERAAQAAWTPADAPLIAEYLDDQNEALNLLNDAMRRETFRSPYLSYNTNGDEMVFPPSRTTIRNMATALGLRATRRVGEGHLEGAIEDVLTVKRLAHLRRQNLTVLEHLVTLGFVGLTPSPIIAIAGHDDLAADQARTFQAELARLSGRFPLEGTYEIGERFIALDAIQAMHPSSNSEVFDEDIPITRPWRFDPNRAMRRANGYFDRLAEAVSLPTRSQRDRRLSQIAAQVENAEQELEHLDTRVRWLISDFHGRATDAFVDYIVEAAYVDPAPRLLLEFDAAETFDQLERTAIAVAGHRAEHGAYPESLDALVPAWLDEVPVDIFDQQARPVRYILDDDRVAIYSVDRNGEDNGGTEGDRPDEGDQLIEWPR